MKEAYETASVDERAKSLQEAAFILRSFVKLNDDAFDGATAVDVLTQCELASSREKAAANCDLLRSGGLIVSASGPSFAMFQDDVTDLYRFPSKLELLRSLDAYQEEEDDDIEVQVAMKAVKLALKFNENDKRALLEKYPSPRLLSTHHRHSTLASPEHEERLTPAPRLFSVHHRRSTLASPEHGEGLALANLLHALEPRLDIGARKYHFKTYKRVFVGSEAVTAMIENDLAVSRPHAVALLQSLMECGLLHHVKHEHSIEDNFLFYRVTDAKDIREALDLMANGRVSETDWTVNERIRHAALMQRWKHAMEDV